MRIGTQGWNYGAWVGPLYPEGTRSSDFLRTYARAFDTVEVDSTFYAIPSANAVRGWVERTPSDFIFALKLPRQITHELRLRGAASLLHEFVERARELGPKLGPVLVQMGPDFGPDEYPALAEFLPLLPRDVRFAFEFRHWGWTRPRVLGILRDHGAALALSDGRWIPRETLLELVSQPTADFHYVRWMGENRDLTDHSRTQIDRHVELDAWTEALRPVAERGVVVWGYFGNHFAGHSPASARQLQQRLGQTPVAPETLREQTTLFG